MAAAVATTTSLMQRRLDVNRVTDDGMDAVAKAVATTSSVCEGTSASTDSRMAEAATTNATPSLR